MYFGQHGDQVLGSSWVLNSPSRYGAFCMILPCVCHVFKFPGVFGSSSEVKCRWFSRKWKLAHWVNHLRQYLANSPPNACFTTSSQTEIDAHTPGWKHKTLQQWLTGYHLLDAPMVLPMNRSFAEESCECLAEDCRCHWVFGWEKEPEAISQPLAMIRLNWWIISKQNSIYYI